MGKADNRLSGARWLGVLGNASHEQRDKLNTTDVETLYRFRFDRSSSFNLSLSGLAKKSNVDVELYRLKRSASEVTNLMGNLEFRLVSGFVLNDNLMLVAASTRRKNRNERLALSNLEAGEYVVRVVGQSGKSRYSLQMGAVALASGKPEDKTKKDTIAPSAILRAANFETEGSSTYDFTVTYNDDVAVSVGSLDNNDVLVTGPNGFSQLATKVSASGDGVASIATYRITAPVGTWSLAENGNYSVSLQSGQVSDNNGNYAPAASLGSFLMNTPLRNPKFSGTSNGPIGSDYIFDFDTASGTLRKFGLTVYTESGKFPEVYDSVQLQLFRNSPGSITEEEEQNLRSLIPTMQFGVSYNDFGSFIGSYQIIYTARLGNKSDIFGKPTTALTLAIKTDNPDLSNPLALLKTALDGETPGTVVKGFYSNDHYYTTQTFDFTTIPSAVLDRLVNSQVLPDGRIAYEFQVTYSDNVAIDISSIDNNDIQVGQQLAKVIAISSGTNKTSITVTYQVLAEFGTGRLKNKGYLAADGANAGWLYSNGVDRLFLMDVRLRDSQVKDTMGNFVPADYFKAPLLYSRYGVTTF